MQILSKYNQVLIESLERAVANKEPQQLYDPIRYILSLGGKRIRPALTLMVCDFLGNDFKKAIPAAMAIELFHNFTLMHDDIMDNAPLRRGAATVHEKWDPNTAILSGDVMLVEAYKLLSQVEPAYLPQVLEIFNDMAAQVCEGQQLDMNFEKRDLVGTHEYLQMIERKTAVLLGASLKIGAVTGGASPADTQELYDFGRKLGIAFQLQDDYLDLYGNPDKFGKQI